jgi:hypothetical protein
VRHRTNSWVETPVQSTGGHTGKRGGARPGGGSGRGPPDPTPSGLGEDRKGLARAVFAVPVGRVVPVGIRAAGLRETA